jgi:hypothetical protein
MAQVTTKGIVEPTRWIASREGESTSPEGGPGAEESPTQTPQQPANFDTLWDAWPGGGLELAKELGGPIGKLLYTLPPESPTLACIFLSYSLNKGGAPIKVEGSTLVDQKGLLYVRMIRHEAISR